MSLYDHSVLTVRSQTHLRQVAQIPVFVTVLISAVNFILTSHVISPTMFPLLIFDYKMCAVGVNSDVEKILFKKIFKSASS